MEAIRLHAFGDSEALVHETVPRPAPAANELLVRVRAAGVNPIDWLVWRDLLPHLVDGDLPWIPGWDLSGVVEAVGADVSGFDPGDQVYGMVRLPGAGGTFAEYATVRPDEVVAKPASLTHTEAAGLPMVAGTAWHALYATGGLGADDRVLIHTAAGGVGHVAVQLAANTGAHVTGTASGRNESYLEDLGVDEFVDYRTERFENVIDPIDLVIDGVGGDVLERSGTVVRRGGTIVTLPDEPPDELVERFGEEYGIDTRFFSVTSDADPAVLGEVTRLVENGVLEPTISGVHPLAEAETALKESEAGHVRGKLVLEMP